MLSLAAILRSDPNTIQPFDLWKPCWRRAHPLWLVAFRSLPTSASGPLSTLFAVKKATSFAKNASSIASFAKRASKGNFDVQTSNFDFVYSCLKLYVVNIQYFEPLVRSFFSLYNYCICVAS